MKKIKVKTPAKINLTLEIVGKRDDGFHNIKSIMQAVDLFDFIEITVEKSKDNIIEISGNSQEIPYDETNIAYKAAQLFLDATNIQNTKISIDIQKNIPVAAGLAGGSSNAAGIFFGLNNIFENILTSSQLDDLAAKLGSDLNFCLHGGTQLASSRGEILEKMPFPKLNLIIAKTKNLGISAKEAYTKFAEQKYKPLIGDTDSMIEALNTANFHLVPYLVSNHLEDAVINDYPVITELKMYLLEKGCSCAMMSGSGPSVFAILEENKSIEADFSDTDFFEVQTIDYGVSIV